MEEENPFISYVQSLTKTKFYGKLELYIEDGKIVHMKKIESIKPQTLTVTIK